MIFAFARDGGLPASSVLQEGQPELPHAGGGDLAGAVLSVCATLYSPAFAGTGRRLCAVPLRLLRHADRRRPAGRGQDWTEFGPFRLGVWSKPFARHSMIGVVILDLCRHPAAVRHACSTIADRLVHPAAGHLVRPREPPLQGPADRRHDRQAPGRDRGRRKGGRRDGAERDRSKAAAGPAGRGRLLHQRFKTECRREWPEPSHSTS